MKREDCWMTFSEALEQYLSNRDRLPTCSGADLELVTMNMVEAAEHMDALTTSEDAPNTCSPDNGPWEAQQWSDNRIVLQSDDFTRDVALEVTGDFGSLGSKMSYALKLAHWMNIKLEATK